MHVGSLPTVEHEQVYLRPLQAADIVRWVSYLHLPAVYEHTSWNFPTVEQLGGYLGCERSTDPAAGLRLAIALKQSDELVGTIGFHSVMPLNHSAELTYDLHPTLWGRGIISAVGASVVGWAHHEAGCDRVQATVLDTNLASQRVIERLGFAKEGLLKHYRYVRGTARDFWIYSHLAQGA